MPSWTPTSALITGASSGIGEALARRLVSRSNDHPMKRIVLVARRRDRLLALAAELGPAAEVLVADLSTREGQAAVADRARDVELLVNNAGFGHLGRFHTMEPQRLEDMVALNVMAPLVLSRIATAAMVERGKGAVLNIASGTGFGPMPYMSAYAATKAFMIVWSEGLRAELRATGVRVSCVCPATTPTEFNAVARVDKIPAAASLVTSSVDDVVSDCVRAVEDDIGLVVTGLTHHFLVGLQSMVPRALPPRVLEAILRASLRD